MSAIETPPSRLGAGVLFVVLVFTLASVFAVNPYTYGTGDNSITIPFLKSWVDPGLYPGDYLMTQRIYYYTYLWNALGALHAHLGIDLEALFFGAYLIAVYFTFLGVYLIAVTLFQRREVAFLALLFLLFSQETLASVRTIELKLNTRGAATPLLLFAIYHFLRGRALLPPILLGLAYLIHPLTAHYPIALILAVSLVDFGRRGWKPLLIGVPAFLVVASPVFVWKALHSAPKLHLLSADPVALAALRARSAHHMFPFDWGWGVWVDAALTMLLFAIAWRGRDRERDDVHRPILIMTWTIVAMVVVGIVGAELHPIMLVVMSQPPRSFQFMKYFAFVYVAHDVLRRMGGGPASVLVAAAMAAALVDHSNRHVIPYVVVVLAVALMAAWRRWRGRDLVGPAFATAMTCIACVTAFACYRADDQNAEDTFAYSDASDTPWRDVQLWARNHSDVRDGFIVPPYEDEEFRLHAERTIYGDMEDGGLMNGNPSFGPEWLRRMHALGLTNPWPAWSTVQAKSEFCGLDAGRVRAIAREMTANPRVFLVWPCQERPQPFAEAYRNEGYVVYEVN